MSDFTYLTIRNLPRPLHAALTKLAASNRRSINAEVVMAVEAHIAANRVRKLAPVRPYDSSDRADLDTTIKRLQKNRTQTIEHKSAPKRAKGKKNA